MTLIAERERTPESEALARADELGRQARWMEALDIYRQLAAASEVPPASVCLRLARACERLGDAPSALAWALAVVDAGDDFAAWQSAWRVAARCSDTSQPQRTARIALLGSYTTTQLAPLLQLAARRVGVAITLFEGDYAQYRQLILDPGSALYRFDPEFVVLAVHPGELDLPSFSSTPEQAVESELSRWTSLWQQVHARSRARVVQHTFVLPAEQPLGHLGTRLPGSRYRMARELNMRLADAAGNDVSIVDCERLAALVGTPHWSDPRFWHLAKHAVAPAAQPLLARHTVAVLAADLGLTRKCLVLDRMFVSPAPSACFGHSVRVPYGLNTVGGVGHATDYVMNLQTLHQEPEVASATTECCLCHASMARGLEHRLVAHHGSSGVLQAAICSKCDDVLGRVVDMFGAELTFVIQQHPQHVDDLVGGPSARTALARSHAHPA